eukprot:798244-Amorphochlora_amoeboformis.AAC.1
MGFSGRSLRNVGRPNGGRTRASCCTIAFVSLVLLLFSFPRNSSHRIAETPSFRLSREIQPKAVGNDHTTTMGPKGVETAGRGYSTGEGEVMEKFRAIRAVGEECVKEEDL